MAETQSDGITHTIRPRPSLAQMSAVIAGNSLEFYDFLSFSYFAIYIGQTFFPAQDPAASLLSSLAVFGVGFLARPIGAIVIGKMADRIGRKPAMLLSFGLMGLSITGLALTPSYAQIGIAAPIIVIIFRLLQGFALGGELGPSTTYLIEAAPVHRRGLYVSLQYTGQGLATVLAGLMGFGLSSVLSDEGLRDYGWRIALLFGAMVVPVGLIIRNRLPETLHDPEPSALTSAAVGAGSHTTLRIALLALVMFAAGSTVSQTLKYLTTYAIGTLHMPAQIAFGGTVISGIVGTCFCPLGGWLSDRFGRKRVMIVPWVLLIILILPAFEMIARFRSAPVFFAASTILSVCGTVGAAAVLVAITEAIPKRIRSGTLAIAYAFALAIFGGSAQFNVAWISKMTGSLLVPAWYMIGGLSLGLAAMFAMRETNPRFSQRAAPEPLRS